MTKTEENLQMMREIAFMLPKGDYGAYSKLMRMAGDLGLIPGQYQELCKELADILGV